MAKTRKINSSRSTTSVDKEIGTRIRMRRVEKSLSQEDLAKGLGITFQQIQKYEQGANRISAVRILTICEMLEVDPNYLMGWQRKPMKGDEMQTLDSLTYRTAMIINGLPEELRMPIVTLVRAMQNLAERM